MLEEKSGWSIVNVKDAMWLEHDVFGHNCLFEGPDGRFPEIGINIAVLQPGSPNCRYHRENVQENFLVLSGQCKVLLNGEERDLGPWDFVHCPAGVSHVFVGAGDGPCAILMIGRRAPDHELFYPRLEAAKAVGAEAPEPTPDPRVAYADVGRREPTDDPPDWPL